MDSTFLNSLLSNVNAGQSPQFVWGRVAGPATLTGRTAAAAAMRPADSERALTLLLGELAGLAVDRQIFRHDFPAISDDAAAVTLAGFAVSPDRRYQICELLLRGKFADRETGATQFHTLVGKLPLPEWVTVTGGNITTSVTVCSLYAAKAANMERIADRGKILTLGILPLTALILIR